MKNKTQLKIKAKQTNNTKKKDELVEEEIIERINSQIQVSTVDNLNYQRDDDPNDNNLISSIDNNHLAKSEVSSLSKDTTNINSKNNKDINNDSFIQKMSVNGLEFNLKSIRSACKGKKNNIADNINKEPNVFKNVQLPAIYFGKKKHLTPIKPQKMDESQVNANVSKDLLHIQNNKEVNNNNSNSNTNTKNTNSNSNSNNDKNFHKKECVCSTKIRVLTFVFVLIALLALVILGIYLK